MKRDNIFIEEKINELILFNKLSIDDWTQELTKLKQGENSYKRPIEEIIKSVQLDISIYQKENMIATYTAGHLIEKIQRRVP